MSFIAKMYSRMSIQQIRAFLLTGAGVQEDRRPYEERIRTAGDRMIASVKEAYPDPLEQERVTEEAFVLAGTYEEVYMELGIQAGLLLATEIYGNRERYTGQAI